MNFKKILIKISKITLNTNSIIVLLLLIYSKVYSALSITIYEEPKSITDGNRLIISGGGGVSTIAPIPDLHLDQMSTNYFWGGKIGLAILIIIIISSIPYVFSKIKKFVKDDNEYTGTEIAISLFSLCLTVLQFLMFCGIFYFFYFFGCGCMVDYNI